jgi:ABC-type glycerol-3-phosphate transport system substrate-binding protein
MDRSQGLTRRALLHRGAALGATASLAGVLQACGSGGGSAGAKGASSGTIAFVKGPHNANELPFQRQLAQAFHQQHPGITVHPSLYDWGQVETQLTTAYAQSSPPDIVYMAETLWPKFAAAGAIRPVDDYIDAAGWKANFDSFTAERWKGVELEGKHYGVPYLVAVPGIFNVNLDLLRKAGVESTWNTSYDAFRAAARKLTQGNVFGYATPTAHTDFAYQNWTIYLHNFGVDVLTADGKGPGFANDSGVQAFDVLRNLFAVDKATPRPGLYDREGLKALFEGGRLAIFQDDAPLQDSLAKPFGFDWDVTLGPPGPAGNTVGGAIGTFHIAAKSKAPDAAFDYVTYLSQPPEVEKFFVDMKVQGGVPARSSVTSQILAADRQTAQFDRLRKKIALEFAPHARGVQPFPQVITAIEGINEEFELLVRGKQTAQQMVDRAAEKVSQVVG